ncbi:MAG TPA: IS66 family transposase [Reyranella sp.]
MSTDAATRPTDLPDDPALLKQINRELLDLVAKQQVKIDGLQQQLDQLRRRLFGHKSEKLNPNQPLLFPELAAATPSDTAMSPPPPDTTEQPAKRRGHGRNGLNPKLRRDRRVYVLDDDQRRCPCGGLCEKFGEDISEQLDYIPASLFVIEHVRTKYACPQCHDQVIVAAKPEQPIAKGLPGPGLLAQVITCKYADHIPLNRFENICRRQGVELSRSTLCDWMKASADLLTPLYDVMASLVLASRSVHTDDTHVPCQDPDRPGKTIAARLWTYLGDDAHPCNVFDFTTTWSRDGPRDFLTKKAGKFQGILQADALSGYDTLCAELGIARAGCWAHARRHFYDARDSAPGPVAEALARIARLYAVEKEIKATLAERQLTGAAADTLRLAVRQEKAVPELTTLCQWLEQRRAAALPKSPFGQAVQYALNHWEALLQYTHYGFLAIDNNAAERALRPIAVGRNNWLFVGSATGGQTAAVLFSFTSTCRRLNLDPFAYLRDVLACLAAGPTSADELSLLLPHRWTPPSNS